MGVPHLAEEEIMVNDYVIPKGAILIHTLWWGMKITITGRRNRMDSDVIEATECLKSWFGIRDFEGMAFWSI